MTQLVLEREFDPPMAGRDVIDMAKSCAWCFEQHSVRWLGSMLAVDGRSMVCRFESSDAESIRQALRKLNTDTRMLWPGTVHQAQEPVQPNVIVERSFDEPVVLEELQAKEDAKRWCLDTYQVRFVRTLLSSDRKRMLCLYSGPDAEAVRASQRKAEMPVDRVWSFVELAWPTSSPEPA
jgi:hypothetical protein